MARERQIKQREDGSFFYPLKRTRKIDVPGTKGLKVEDAVEVPQLGTEGDIETIVQNAINVLEGKDDAAKVENLVRIINAGLIMDAQTSMQTRLNQKMNSNQVVSDFGNIVTLMKSMFPDLDDKGRAELILDKFPQIAERLSAAGLELVTDDDVEEDDADETEE